MKEASGKVEIQRKRRAAAWTVAIVAVFTLFGLVLVLEIRSAQVGIWTSALSVADKYLWFGRLQTAKTITGFAAILLGLIAGSYAWRSGQKPE